MNKELLLLQKNAAIAANDFALASAIQAQLDALVIVDDTPEKAQPIAATSEFGKAIANKLKSGLLRKGGDGANSQGVFKFVLNLPKNTKPTEELANAANLAKSQCTFKYLDSAFIKASDAVTKANPSVKEEIEHSIVITSEHGTKSFKIKLNAEMSLYLVEKHQKGAEMGTKEVNFAFYDLGGGMICFRYEA
jgi:hypothetical protein